MKIKSLLKATLICLTYPIATSFQPAKSLKGVWEYEGGVYNGHIDGSFKAIKRERVYSENQFEGFMTGKDGKRVKWEAGNYSLNDSKYLETQTYCNKPSPIKGKTMRYDYAIRNNRLIYNGKLPNKTPMEEYWKKVK